MSIYSVPFAVYERLASAKMNAFEDAINSHTHDGSYGVKIPFSYLDGYISVSQFIDNSISGSKLIDGSVTGDKIATGTVTSNNILDGTITVPDCDTNVSHSTSIKMDSNGYAYYAP